MQAPESLDPQQRIVLWLLVLASMSFAFVNTLFTQTVAFAAEEFNISNGGQGIAAAIVRWGIVITFPFVLLADKKGRRRVIVMMSWLAPIVCALGALSPSFSFLVATQTIGRPLGLTLEVLIAVVTVESMPAQSRAYSAGLLGIATGVGAGVAVAALPLADIGPRSWRLVYVVALVWLIVAAILTKWLPETQRFLERAGHKVRNEKAESTRLRLLASVAFLSNIFVATASIFQNRYLKDVRGYDALLVAIFTTATSAPAALGLVAGGRIADVRGRRLVVATMIPCGSLLLATSFTTSGLVMWSTAILGGIAFGIGFPAISVYRGEMFPTARRGIAGGTITAASLVGGSVGLILAGQLIDGGLSYGTVMLVFTVAPCLASVLVWLKYPETAHRELEDINPGDVVID